MCAVKNVFLNHQECRNIYSLYRITFARFFAPQCRAVKLTWAFSFLFFGNFVIPSSTLRKSRGKKHSPRHNLTSESEARWEGFQSHSSWRVMASGWHLKRRTLHQDAQGERRRVLRVHVALGGPICVAVVKSGLFILVRGVIKGWWGVEGGGWAFQMSWGQHGEPFQTALAFRQKDSNKKQTEKKESDWKAARSPWLVGSLKGL